MKMLRLASLLFAITSLGVLAPLRSMQSTIDSSTCSSIIDDSPSPAIKCPQADLVSRCRTERTTIRTCSSEVFGPHPIAGVAMVAAHKQAVETPLNSSTEDHRTPCLAVYAARHIRERTPAAPATAEDKL
jgi:hypothetical protein